MSNRPTLALGLLLAIAATLAWSGNFIIARAFSTDIGPITLSTWRWSIAVVVLAPFALPGLIAQWRIYKKHLGYIAMTSFIGISCFNTLIYTAGQTSQAGNLALIAAFTPIFTLLFARLVLGEALGYRRILGMTVAIFGIFILVTNKTPGQLLQDGFVIGDLYVLLAALLFAGYGIMIKRKPEELTLLTFTFVTFGVGTVFLLPAYLWEWHQTGPVDWGPDIILALVYVGVVASVFAFLAWNKAIDLIGPSYAGFIYLLIPVFSSLLGWGMLNEALSWWFLLSMILILGGVILAKPRINI